jgi:hypothetical protein
VRRNDIGYRARALPYWYGALGQDKIRIGRRMQEECMRRGLRADIEWSEEKRIYGPGWYEFLGDCRAMLGSESGANVFDEDGSIQAGIREALAREPFLTYAEIERRFLVGRERPGFMNQISPRIFEAIALRTALILFEGDYSGVVRPGEHYIPLKRDFSNVDQVIDAVQDVELLTQLTERAHADVIRSGLFGYPRFVGMVDDVIAERIAATEGKVTDARARAVIHVDAPPSPLSTRPLRAPVPVHVAPLEALALHPRVRRIAQSVLPFWPRLPRAIRNRLKPAAYAALRVASRLLYSARRAFPHR